MGVLVGTSGWQYASWKGLFYPSDVPQARWLEHYAVHFRTVELNNSFYRLPPRETFEAWRSRTPEDFVVVVKASRYLSHIKRLREPDEPVRRFVAAATGLGDKLGPVLVQLPPDMKIEVGRLRETLDVFRAVAPTMRITLEPRHDTWFVDEVLDLLRERNVALCLADGTRRTTPPHRTADWGYVRLHDGTDDPRPCYTQKALAAWAERLASIHGPDDEVYAFFNNDPRGCAVRDASRFAAHLRAVGLHPTRVPDEALAPVS